jgi:hypothetical protein
MVVLEGEGEEKGTYEQLKAITGNFEKKTTEFPHESKVRNSGEFRGIPQN